MKKENVNELDSNNKIDPEQFFFDLLNYPPIRRAGVQSRGSVIYGAGKIVKDLL